MSELSRAFKCIICDRTFTTSSNLSRHRANVHNLSANCENFGCILCGENQPSNNDYIAHLRENHELSIKNEENNFDRFEDFLAWKSKLEGDTRSNFIKKTGTRKSKDYETHYFICSRTGSYSSLAMKRLKKVQGSKKIGGRCPAFITAKVDVRSGSTLVTFSVDHVGHSSELKHLALSQDDRERIAADLALNIPKERILRDIRSTVDSELSRVHLITKKDLQNIEASYNLFDDMRHHSDDFTSIEAWIEQCKDLEDNPVLLYQPGNDSKEGFMLGIMNDYQRFMLKKFGSNIVCIDSTHGTNAYKFQLTTLLIIDDNNHGFPAHTNRGFTAIGRSETKRGKGVEGSSQKKEQKCSCITRWHHFHRYLVELRGSSSNERRVISIL
ncbi:uncharacterized protein LOC141852725 [Brevipalpus obovatus]|uniref:uncharacterized protein LOC141852725 n=1 Tax=Brevipalpus obovatus TaxID=246614 RepID=UPI003D9F22A6